MGGAEDDQKQELVESLRRVRDEAREKAHEPERLPEYPLIAPSPRTASPVAEKPPGSTPVSPDRAFLNDRWNVASALVEPSGSVIGRALSPVRAALRRIVQYALGPFVERQAELNSAQVRFDNEVVAYLDARLDRVSAHYDHVLGLHGKRMEEIDERHLILQQELIRHVHELVKRIEFVFENAEQNHVVLDGTVRELREEIRALAARLPS